VPSGETINRHPPADALLPDTDPGRLALVTCTEAKDPSTKPLLMVDIDGVISLFGFPAHAAPLGSFHSIDGIPHFLSAGAGKHLLTLSLSFELVWASGWEEKANEYLPHLLGLPQLPFLRFERSPGKANAHWKLDAIETHAGERPLAWLDDAFNDACHAWSDARAAPTLLVTTMPADGLTDREVTVLSNWVQELATG
jgi:hypothetical protein